MKTELSDDQLMALLQEAGFHNADSPYLACGTMQAFRRLIALLQDPETRQATP